MGTATPSRDTAAEQVCALMARKENIEAELEAQLSILKVHNCNMQTPLVDEEGFPRADIDVWAVRHARVRIIELRNDLRGIMDEILKGLQGVYNPALVQQTTPNPAESAPSSTGLQPFAKVDGVAPGSPAAAAVRVPFVAQAVALTLLTSGTLAGRSCVILRIANAFLILSKLIATIG